MSPSDLERVLHALPDLVLVVRADRAFTIAEASDAYLHATHTQRERIVGRPLFEVFPGGPADAKPSGPDNLRASLARVLATKSADRMPYQDYPIRREGGGVGEFEGRTWSPLNTPVLSDDGEVVYILHRVEDVTATVEHEAREERRTAELVEANERFRAIYDQGLFAGTLDLEGRVTDLNRSSLERCGYVRSEMIGKPFWECGWWNRSPDVQDWVRAAVAQAIRGEAFHGESRYFWADGTERVVDFACMPIRDAAGRVVFVFPTGIDVTERVRARRELRATEILESITEGFFGLDEHWRFNYVNSAAGRILGCRPEELVGQILWERYPGLRGSPFERVYREAMTARVQAALTAYYPDHDRWYEAHVYPAQEGLSIYFRDVTMSKRAEAEREEFAAESERRRIIYEAALSNTPDLVYVWGLDHRFVYANEALLSMWGKTREEALGKHCIELGYEPWHAEMHDREIEQVVATRTPLRGEVPFTGTNGRRIYDYILVPVLGPDGDVVAVAGTTRDVTERQQAEQAIRDHSERLSAADRAKDDFLATLSHELRNPLAPLRNSLELLRFEELGRPDGSATTKIRERMQRQIEHLVRLVDDLLEMARISRGELELRKERVEASHVVHHAVETSEPLIRAGSHDLSVVLPDEPLWLDGDPVRLSQILANLLNNAAKYTEDGGRIALVARRREDRIVISVRDNGVGIAPDKLPRMFDMFSRGDRASGRSQGGLGIGLALARRLTEMHGGRIDAHSEGPGKGSEFSVELPLADLITTRAPKATSENSRSLSGLRVLVVDDNTDAAESLGLVLGVLGAHVRLANDGPEALEHYGPYAPTVVLLDIGMPGMDGYEVARTMRSRFPDRRTAIVALTGWGQDEDRRQALEAGFDHHLIKPAEIGALQALLASIAARSETDPGDWSAPTRC